MQEKIRKIFISIFSYLKVHPWLILAVVVLLFAVSMLLRCSLRNQGLHLAPVNEKIDITPEQIRSIERIGEWEFLSISDEEFVEKTRKGFFSDSKLARIYVGTLRLGVDMRQAGKDWLTVHHDTLVAVLPPVGLLDKRFIDEARTRSFYESGNWTAADREEMYQQAYHKMMARCLSPVNIRKAEDNAREQFSSMFRSMGYPHVVINFRKQ